MILAICRLFYEAYDALAELYWKPGCRDRTPLERRLYKTIFRGPFT